MLTIACSVEERLEARNDRVEDGVVYVEYSDGAGLVYVYAHTWSVEDVRAGGQIAVQQTHIYWAI